MELSEGIYPAWQTYMFDHSDPIQVLDNPSGLYRLIPPAQQRLAMKTIAELREWIKGPRKIYRVIAIADWDDEFEGPHADEEAADRFAKNIIDDQSLELGNHWSREWSGDHHAATGAGMGYDVDAEGFPILLAATVEVSDIHWGQTIALNIAYPEEKEITAVGTVSLRYIEVNDTFHEVSVTRPTGGHDRF